MSEHKNVLIADCDEFLRAPLIDTSSALRLCDVEARFDEVKRKLEKLYGDDVTVTADGKTSALKDLTAAKEISIDGAADGFNKQRYNAVDALRVIARLTEPDGCPWDRAQTHESIRINMIEEAYEAVDAIDKRDVANMREEFGDVFLQSILQSDIARRMGEFDFDDVCDELCKKLIGRHTFIFGTETANNADEALVGWEKAKAKEKHYTSVADQLKKLPDNFPSLLLAEKVYKKRKKAGDTFDPENELKAAVSEKDYVGAIIAAVELLADSGRDAEVEVNLAAKRIIASLK